jgi:ketosteroid isomerase-like protein
MTRLSLWSATLLVAITTAAGCSRQEPTFDLSALRTKIQAENDRFTRAHIAGDVAEIDAMFTRDARSFPPGAEAAIGLAAIHDLTVEYLKGGIKEFREETTDFYGNEEFLVDQGNYVVTYGLDSTVERGNYLNVWKREDGAWKIRTNVWNTSAPPPAAK